MNFKELLENKLFKLLAIIIGALLVIVIVIVIIVAVTGGRLSYTGLENKMISAARSYYQNNTDLLPGSVGGKAEVTVTTLEEGGYLKSLEKLAPKNSNCSGRVVVKNVNQGYFYQAFLNCGDNHQTTTLASYIRSHENTVAIGQGLYSINGNLVYRGESPNNYIMFADRLYYITRINSDDTIDVIAVSKNVKNAWDDRYNADRGRNDGINDFTVSRARDALLAYVNSDSFTDSDRNMLEPFSLCTGKVGVTDEYSLDMECSQTYDGQVIGLLPISSYLYASLDATCKTSEDGTCENYNYLASEYNWWTLTGNSSNTYGVYTVKSGGNVYSSRCLSNYYLRETLRLTENVVYVGGSGTELDPYIIK